MDERSPAQSNLTEIAKVFLKLGTTAFGGPAAHIAMMNDEIVVKRRWLSQEDFLDMLSATNFIPGPNSTEMAIHIGYARGGWRGLLMAGVCFILPAALIVLGIAHLYVSYGYLPQVQSILLGVKPVIISVVAQAIWSFSKTAIKGRFLGFLGMAALLGNGLGANELAVLVICGVLSFIYFRRPSARSLFGIGFISENPTALVSSGVGAAMLAIPVSTTKIFLFFLKIGSVLFGSGYVLLAFLKADLVDRWQWISEAQLIDAIAVGQFTPGPVFTTATFIGYLLHGFSGAVAATVGIFLPAFVFVGLTAPLVAKLKKSKNARAVLDGINVASLAIMTVAWILLSKSVITNGTSLFMSLISLLILVRYKLNSVWLIIAGGIAGYLFFGPTPL